MIARCVYLSLQQTFGGRHSLVSGYSNSAVTLAGATSSGGLYAKVFGAFRAPDPLVDQPVRNVEKKNGSLGEIGAVEPWLRFVSYRRSLGRFRAAPT